MTVAVSPRNSEMNSRTVRSRLPVQVVREVGAEQSLEVLGPYQCGDVGLDGCPLRPGGVGRLVCVTSPKQSIDERQVRVQEREVGGDL